MKTTLLTLALLLTLTLTSNVDARSVATLPNKGGGQIIFTDEACSLANSPFTGTAYDLFSRSTGGATTLGCYIVGSEFITARWLNDSTLYTYRLSDLTDVPAPAPTMNLEFRPFLR